MAKSLTPFLMFQGAAEEAMRFYVELFPGSEVEEIERYGVDETGGEGTVKRARFNLLGQELICIDSPAEHTFGFTPALSLFIECESEHELDRLFGKLAHDGEILMPPDAYGFSRRFTWLNDRFGVSWQLNVG